MLVASTPRHIDINGRWKDAIADEHLVAITFGEDVPQENVSVSTSSSHISARLQDRSLKIGIDSLPVGDVNERVTIKYSSGDTIYSYIVPIKGKVLPPMEVSPTFLNFVDAPPGDLMAADLYVKSTDSTLLEPKIQASGDWEVRSIEKSAESTWKVKLGLRNAGEANIRYGKVHLSGNWKGDRIRVPISGNHK
jgi:hypothetical protein